ncbi:hypothetical protein ELQ92_12040 [Labedella populi]|uniref:Acyltransferase 3 domain-containing protein n=1 Tax=Labedella populi TaxID=2498850 RepID=A0A3S4BYY9_9MICO|nr:acyltransferase family protein [Labedella populi]RWZ59556.1 hypothetical protein ELQ92_12040 [Labedella populi]
MSAAPESRAGRHEWVDAGRGLAIVLVALYHATDWLSVGFDTTAWHAASAVLATLRMPLFFVLAGLFAGKWLAASWRSLWNSKLSLFVWVFLVWGAIGSLASVVGRLLQGYEIAEFSPPAILRAWLLSPIAPRFELWFIWALALFFVAAKLLRRVDPRIQLTVAALVSAAALSGWETPNIGWSGVLKYFVFFLAGLYLKEHVLRLGRRRPGPLLFGAVAAWAALSIAVPLFGLRTVPGLYFVNCVLGVVAGVMIARVLVRVPRLPAIGANTLPVYLTHTPVIILTTVVLVLLDGIVPLDVLVPVLPPLVALTAITLSLVLSGLASRGLFAILYRAPHRLSVLAAR